MANRKEPVEINLEEYVGLLKYTAYIHHRLAFVLAFEAGLRFSEIKDLLPGYIDVENKRIWVSPGRGGNRARFTCLPVSWSTEHHLKYIPITYSSRALEKTFKKSAKKSGLLNYKPNATFDSLRYGFATFLAQQKVDIRDIQQLMGHKSVSTTGKYIITKIEDALESARKAFK